MDKPKIDPVFSRCHRKLTQDEFEQLEDNIISDCEIIDPIKTWKGFVVDGEHRLKIALKHKMEYKTKEVEFSDRQEVIDWIMRHQIGRRNLDAVAMTNVRARIFKESGDIEQVSNSFGVVPRTIQRDIETVAVIEGMPEDIKGRLEAGSLVATPKDLRRFGLLTDAQKNKACEALRKDPMKTLKGAMPVDEKKNKAAHLTESDHQILSQSLSPTLQHRIAQGAITASTSDVRRLGALDPIVRETVDSVLAGGEVKDIGEAISMLNIKKPKNKTSIDIDKLREKAAGLFGQLKRLVDEIAAATGKSAVDCQNGLKLAEGNLP